MRHFLYYDEYGKLRRNPSHCSMVELEELFHKGKWVIESWEASIHRLKEALPELRELGARIDALRPEARRLTGNTPGFLSTLFSSASRAASQTQRDRLQVIEEEFRALMKRAEHLLGGHVPEFFFRAQGATQADCRTGRQVFPSHREEEEYWKQAHSVAFRPRSGVQDTGSALVDIAEEEVSRWLDKIDHERRCLRPYVEELEKRKRIQAVQNAKDAKAAKLDGVVRDHASAVIHELERTDLCPYCSRPLGDSPQADHIYPVALGGLSIPENLVYVCLECNQEKGARTLREFIEDTRLDRAMIEATLKQLGKKF